MADLVHDRQQVVDIDRLADVAIGMRGIGAHHVFMRTRAGHDHDRYAHHARIGLEHGEQLMSRQPRQVEVEQNQVRHVLVRMQAFATQHRQRLGSVFGNRQAMQQFALAQGFGDQANVARVVLDEKDLQGARTGTADLHRDPLPAVLHQDKSCVIGFFNTCTQGMLPMFPAQSQPPPAMRHEPDWPRPALAGRLSIPPLRKTGLHGPVQDPLS